MAWAPLVFLKLLLLGSCNKVDTCQNTDSRDSNCSKPSRASSSQLYNQHPIYSLLLGWADILEDKA